MRLVVAHGEALLEHLHEGAEIPHEGLVPVDKFLQLVEGTFGEELGDLFACVAGDGIGDGEDVESFEKPVMAGEVLGRLWDLDGEVEVVAHDAIGNDANATELGVLLHEGEEEVLLLGTEDELSVDDAGDAVVVSNGKVGWGQDARSTHEPVFHR